MNSNSTIALIEAILFLENKPIDLALLSKITELPKGVLVEAIDALNREYQNAEHGLEIVEIGGGYCFTPKKKLWNSLKNHYGSKNNKKLSKAALETLAIIAYSQPITKAEIEGLRGVSADGMIKLLLDSELIRVTGKSNTPGRPVQYGTTKNFLIKFGLKSIADLPKLEEPDRERFERYAL